MCNIIVQCPLSSALLQPIHSSKVDSGAGVIEIPTEKKRGGEEFIAQDLIYTICQWFITLCSLFFLGVVDSYLEPHHHPISHTDKSYYYHIARTIMQGLKG